MFRRTYSGFSTLGTLQSRAVEVAGESATVDATRSFVAAARHAEIDVLGGGLAGRSYAVPDGSGGVAAMFKVVYPI